MSTTQWIILVIVILVALLLIAAVVSMGKKRKAEQQRAHAEELRTQAATRAPDLQQSSLQARHEDVLREADRVDPDVNHRSGDYTPTTPATPAMGTPAAEPGTTGTTGTTGSGTPGYDETSTAHGTTTEGTTTEGGVVNGTEGTRGSHRADGSGTTPA